MTTDTRHQNEENELDRDIGKVSSNWARLGKEEPPDLLDQVVLNRAKRALESPGRAGRKPWVLRWPGAFATAAVVLLALTVVLEQEQQAPAPVLKKADGFRIDPDGSAAGKEANRKEAVPEESVTHESLADKTPAAKAGSEARSSPLRLESASIQAAAEQDSAGIASGLEKSTDEIPAADAWIDQLIQLKKTHQDEKLAKELTRFRAIYPDYPLPSELDD